MFLYVLNEFNHFFYHQLIYHLPRLYTQKMNKPIELIEDEWNKVIAVIF